MQQKGLDINPFKLTKDLILEIMREVAIKIGFLKIQLIEEYEVTLSNKNLSEIVSKIMEKSTSTILTKRLGYEVKCAKSDQEPDLFFTKLNKPLEIKVTSTTTAWTGGEFSQRPFDHLLVSWDSESFEHFFVCLVHLEKEDWKSNFQNNFYGPSYNKKKLFEKKDKIIFIGDLIKEGNRIKLVRENPNKNFQE